MTKTFNIRNEADRAELYAAGFRWVCVQPRGDSKGRIISKHHTYELAEKAARGRELHITDVRDDQF